MAEWVVAPLIELLIEKAASGLWKEIGLLRGVKKDIKKLENTLSTINDVLDDAEKRSISETSVSNWLKRLKDAAYDADDVLDLLQTEALRRQWRIENHDGLPGRVRDFFSSHNPVSFSHSIARKIKDVLKELDEIAADRIKFHLKSGSSSIGRAPRPRETHSSVVESEVFGRDDDKKKIINYLINEENEKDLSVLPIVGLGGLGKTTLAQLVYNDDQIKSFFDLRIWVCVSDDPFDVKEIIRKIIECINDQKYRDLELQHLSQLLQKTIGGKRFLLILDDVWNEDRERWEDSKSLLRCGRNGSKIVTTTRSEIVANVMGTTSPHRLNGLSFDDCWNLFRQRAFGSGEENETPELTKIGKEIVEKCGGLPLAAKALGSLMGSKRGEHEWLAIRDSEIWELTDEDKILPALNLSYHHLPSHLKRCFVYCSLFPKDYEFDKKELIRLWISEGFVASTNENVSLEDVGNQCFNDLLGRSFFQDIQKDIYGDDIVTCKMHDLVHDLACKVGKNEFNLTTYSTEITNCDKYRYLLLIIDDKSPQVLDLNCETKKLRSLKLMSSYRINEVSSEMFVKLRSLRVLSLSGCGISILPSTISKLKHLRFLDLSESSIKILPTSIGCLYNLSTLILSYCRGLQKLPSTITRLHNLHTLDVSNCYVLAELPCDISKMKNLRHLDNRDCIALSEMPTRMGQLSNLQTLPVFIVGEEEGHHISELQQLNRIRGHLTIKNLQKVSNPVEASEANLRAKTHVKELVLEWDEGRDEANVSEEEVLERLVPPPNLKRLELLDYLGISYPSWLQSSTNLVYIKLSNLKKLERLPPLGQLPYLKHLELEELAAIRRIGEEFYGEAGGGDINLEEWVVERGDIERDIMFPSLNKLLISYCPELGGLPPLGQLPYLKHLKLEGLRGIRRIGEEFYGEALAGGGDKLPFQSLEKMELIIMDNLEEWVVERGDIERDMMFPSLNKLEIGYCPKLTRVEPGLPVSVVDLEINREVVLAAESMSGMKRVRRVIIYRATSSSFPWDGLHYFTALVELKFTLCSEMRCLPEGLIHLHIPTLRTLEIKWCGAMTSLVGNENENENGEEEQQQPPQPQTQTQTQTPTPPLFFTSLHHLIIDYCSALTALPEWVGGLTSLQTLEIKGCDKLEMLPDGLQHLTTLQQLRIEYCSDILERRCKRETGEDWHKIAHIPNIQIISSNQPETEENNSFIKCIPIPSCLRRKEEDGPSSITH